MLKVGQTPSELPLSAYRRGRAEPLSFSLADLRGRWVVLFFYPRDFTFICPTEIEAFAALEPEFLREEAVIVGASTDSFHVHKAWYEQDARLRRVQYPVIADTSHHLAEEFGVLLGDGAALRGTFILDPNGVVRHMQVNDLDVGRDPAETLRVLRALRTGELCPVAWKPGTATLSIDRKVTIAA